MKALLTLAAFAILLLECRLVVSPIQRGTGNERDKFPVKDQENIWLLFKILGKWLSYKFRRFWMVFSLFLFWVTLSVLEKSKKLIFDVPVIPQTLNINNWRTTGEKSINLDTIRKLIVYPLKTSLWRQCLLMQFLRYCCWNVGRHCQGTKGLRIFRSVISLSVSKTVF